MLSGLHQAKLENCPTSSFGISSKRETSLWGKFNLREQPAFQRGFRPGEGGGGEIRSFLQSFIPGGFARKEDREIHCWTKWKGAKLFHLSI